MISFSYQNDFSEIDHVIYSTWLNRVAQSESFTIGDLGYVFCSDDYLHKLNLDYLKHDTLTDIITFDYSQDGLIHGEIYVSTDRVSDNAVSFRESVQNELHRVMVHGLLHLMGYPDKTAEEKQIMRFKETEKMEMFHVKQ